MPAALSGRFTWLTRERLVLIGLLLFSAVVRGGGLWGMRDNLNADPDAYREIAENVLQHGVYSLGQDGPPTPTAYRPPLYPIVLSNLPAADGKHVSLRKVAVLHVLLGMATVWLTWLTAHRLLGRVGQASKASADPRGEKPKASGGREPPEANQDSLHNSATSLPRGSALRLTHPTVAATLAALLVACDPILLNQQTLVMTETLATLLAILSLWCLVRFSGHRYWWNAALAGGAIGLAALCRPTFLPWLGLVGFAVISDFGFRISDWRRWLHRALPSFVALAVAAAAVMSPWAIRNQREFGKPMLTTTHGGYTLLLGNNREFYLYLKSNEAGEPWQPSNDFHRLLFRVLSVPQIEQLQRREPQSELSADAVFYEIAKLEIEDNPRSFFAACIYRIRQLWSPLPHKLMADESTGRMLLRYVTAAWYCGVYLLAAVGVWRLRWRLFLQPWVWGVLLCLAFTAVHTFYWCNLRMRAPLMPFVALVAAVASGAAKPPINRQEDLGQENDAGAKV